MMTYNFPCRPQQGDTLIGGTGFPSAYGRIAGGNNITVTYGNGSCTIASSGGSAESMPYVAGQVQTVGTATQTIATLSPNVAVVNAGWGQGQLIGVDDADPTYVRAGAYFIVWNVTGGTPALINFGSDIAYIWDQLVTGVGDTNSAITASVVGANIEIEVTGLAGRTMNWSTEFQYFEVTP